MTRIDHPENVTSLDYLAIEIAQRLATQHKEWGWLECMTRGRRMAEEIRDKMLRQMDFEARKPVETDVHLKAYEEYKSALLAVPRATKTTKRSPSTLARKIEFSPEEIKAAVREMDQRQRQHLMIDRRQA